MDVKQILERVVKELDNRFDNNIKAVEQMTREGRGNAAALFGAAAKEDYDLITVIDELCAEMFLNLHENKEE